MAIASLLLSMVTLSLDGNGMVCCVVYSFLQVPCVYVIGKKTIVTERDLDDHRKLHPSAHSAVQMPTVALLLKTMLV